MFADRGPVERIFQEEVVTWFGVKKISNLLQWRIVRMTAFSSATGISRQW